MPSWCLHGGRLMTISSMKISLDGPEGLRKSDYRRLGKQTFVAAGKRHRRRNLHHHFERRATQRYGYPQRKGERNPRRRGTYSNRKLRLFGHIKPLVWSGELRRLTLNGIQYVRAVAKSGGEIVSKIRLPRKANLKNPKSKVHPLEDLRRFHVSELHDLDQFVAEDFDRRISRLN